MATTSLFSAEIVRCSEEIRRLLKRRLSQLPIQRHSERWRRLPAGLSVSTTEIRCVLNEWPANWTHTTKLHSKMRQYNQRHLSLPQISYLLYQRWQQTSETLREWAVSRKYTCLSDPQGRDEVVVQE